MAWDFSTDLEFQEKLDWVEQFCREQIEPLTLAFPAAGWPVGRPPAVDRLVDGLKDQVKEQGLWGIFLDKDIGGPRFRTAQARAPERDPRRVRLGAGDLRLPGT
jgi:acyl-CoA dehydrogenase